MQVRPRLKRVVLRLDTAASAAVVAAAWTAYDGAMNEHAAMANLFTAVLAMYLSRVGGGERIAVGVTFHNRMSRVVEREALPFAL